MLQYLWQSIFRGRGVNSQPHGTYIQTFSLYLFDFYCNSVIKNCRLDGIQNSDFCDWSTVLCEHQKFHSLTALNLTILLFIIYWKKRVIPNRYKCNNDHKKLYIKSNLRVIIKISTFYVMKRVFILIIWITVLL